MERLVFDMPSLDLDIHRPSDGHVGAVNCHYGMLDDIGHALGQRRSHAIFGGDMVEGISPNDPRFAIKSVDLDRPTLDLQMSYVIEKFSPNKKRIIGWHDGNHELKLANVINPGLHMATQLGVQHAAYNAVVECRYHGRLILKIFSSHGFGQLVSNAKDQLQREGNMNASLKQKLISTGISDCVVMVMGHTHQLRVVPPTVDLEINLAMKRGKVKQVRRAEHSTTDDYIPPEHRWYVNSGSALKLYSEPGSGATSYAEMRGYKPTHLGWPVIQIRDGRVKNIETIP